MDDPTGAAPYDVAPAQAATLKGANLGKPAAVAADAELTSIFAFVD